jgi:hypothetical protein
VLTNFQDKFRLVGENVAKVRTDVMQEQLATFRSQLEDFARKHKVIRCSLYSVACVRDVQGKKLLMVLRPNWQLACYSN